MIFFRLTYLLFRKLNSFTDYGSSTDLDAKDVNSLTVLQVNHSRIERFCYGKVDIKECRDFTGNKILCYSR